MYKRQIEDNAGAYVAPDTLARARARGMKIDQYLDRNDAYCYFEPLGDLVITGPTHTNVNDFRAILVFKSGGRCGEYDPASSASRFGMAETAMQLGLLDDAGRRAGP